MSNWLCASGYAGSKGTHLLQGWERNAGIYIPGQSTYGNTDSRRPYHAFTSIEEVDSGSGSNYHSLQLSLDKRFSRGFSILANYTLAKSIDYGSGGGTLWPDFTDPFNHSIDYGLSDFDRQQRFVVSGLWELPRLTSHSPLLKALSGGWDLAGVLTLQSGPFRGSQRQGQFLLRRRAGSGGPGRRHLRSLRGP